MSTDSGMPSSLRDAGAKLRRALAAEVDELSKGEFLRGWYAIAYTFPGLHPDGFDDYDSGWPRALRRFASEAWRRADEGELSDEELYPNDAQRAGIYGRIPAVNADRSAH